MLLKVENRNVFGNELIYPACEMSKRLAEFKGSKTFTQSDMYQLSAMGYKFEFVASVPDYLKEVI
jgi:hypothetical protein